MRFPYHQASSGYLTVYPRGSLFMWFVCALIPTHYNCGCILVLTTLKMATSGCNLSVVVI